ncbi:MAG: phage major tail tube protein [Candidatus Pacearchaeota archaeon]|nr:phage major tail tube protein [Candidatus Pacearchaeota archaeon]
MALPKKLKNFNGFIDGVGYAGRIIEQTLPKLARKMEEYRAGGMNGPIDVDMGQEKMESEFSIAEFSRDVLLQYGVTGADGVQMRFRGAAVSDSAGSETDAIEVVMRGRFKEIDMGTVKTGEDTPMKVSASLSYYKYVLNDETLIEIDLLNMVEIVGGEDRLKEQREAIGL